jgi:hypothetical protein
LEVESTTEAEPEKMPAAEENDTIAVARPRAALALPMIAHCDATSEVRVAVITTDESVRSSPSPALAIDAVRRHAAESHELYAKEPDPVPL